MRRENDPSLTYLLIRRMLSNVQPIFDNLNVGAQGMHAFVG
jgi:hypothetical protein